jgi:hypothetical protein
MNAEQDWLRQLEVATNYKDLQNLFVRMSQESQQTIDGDSLIARIDEAIRRLEAERSSDQAELEQLSTDYEAFKQQQSGVVGWLKRKMPFTETRSQELQHRDAVNDQAAEILADNLIIARAQILKEKIASPTLRRMGQRPSYWRGQLVRCDSIETMSELGSLLHQLNQELVVARQFFDMVSAEIDAFSAAKFASKDDQLRKNADLSAAQEERQLLKDELQEKEDLKKSALVTLKGLLIQDLSDKDPDFRINQKRFEALVKLLELQPKTIQLAEQHLGQLKSEREIQEQLGLIPEQRTKSNKKINALTEDLRVAEQRRLRTQSDLEEPSRLYQSALRQSQEATACLNASKKLYEAYLAEQSNVENDTMASQPEVSSNQDFEPEPPGVLKEYQRLEKAADEAAQALKLRAPLFESAKRLHDEACQHFQALHGEFETLSAEVRKMSQRESELQEKLQRSRLDSDASQRELCSCLEPYLEIARAASWTNAFEVSSRCLHEFLQPSVALGGHRAPAAFGRSQHDSVLQPGLHRRNTDIDALERLITAVKADHQFCQKEVPVLAKHRKEMLQRRAQMMFEQSVYTELLVD